MNLNVDRGSVVRVFDLLGVDLLLVFVHGVNGIKDHLTLKINNYSWIRGCIKSYW